MTVPAALDAFLASYFRLRPVNATFTGMHEHDHRLPDWSHAGLESSATEMRPLRDELGRASSLLVRVPADGGRDRPSLPFSSLDISLADAFLEIQLAEDATRHFVRGNPSLWAGEAIFGVLSLVTRPFAPIDERLRASTARMAAIARFLGDAPRTIGDGQVPAEWVRRARRECAGAAILFGASLPQWVGTLGIDGSLVGGFRAAADGARIAFEAFDAWLAGRPTAPERAYACGPDLLHLLLARGHWCDTSGAALLAEARDALADARAELARRAARAAPGGWPEVQERLAAAHPDAATYLAAFDEAWHACRALAERLDLVSWPDAPVRFGPIPAHVREAAPYLYYLYYRSPAPLEPVDVHDHVVPPLDMARTDAERERLLRATNHSVIRLNHVVHHAALGHHVQNAFARDGGSVVGRIAAVDCASRIGMFCGGTMAEGWACYATESMEDAGFLTELETVAEAHTRVRLLARAVMDLSLHEGSMRFEEAVAFYGEATIASPDVARSEAVKASMFPGTASMYWLGVRAIHALRRERERAEGSAFSLRRFHDAFLSHGSIPVPLIARSMTGEASHVARA